MVKEYACRACKALTNEKVCPLCGSSDLSPDWSGLVIILDPERSQVAKTLGLEKPWRYALRVS